MKSCLSFAFSAVVCLLAAVVISGCGSSSPVASGGGTTQTPPPASPAIASITPTSVPAGPAPVTLTVAGSGFFKYKRCSGERNNGPTTYVSATELTTVLPAADLASGAVLQITVSNGGAGTVLNSSAAPLEVDNPVPVITGSSPSGLLSGATPTAVTVTGSGFVPATVIQVNGTARATTYIDATHVSLSLTVNDLANPGSIALVAINPAPGGGTWAGAYSPRYRTRCLESFLSPKHGGSRIRNSNDHLGDGNQLHPKLYGR